MGEYTITSLGTDSLVNGVKFYKYDQSIGGRVYLSKVDGVYTSYGTSPAGEKLFMVGLKDAPVGTKWKNTFDNQGTISHYNYEVISRDVDKTVNGKLFKNVITVQYVAIVEDPTGGQPIEFASGRSYYAKGVGPIASKYDMDFFGITMQDSTYIVSYNIK
jgi:hypothetical protein